MAELLRMPEVAAGAESALLSAWPLSPGTSYVAGEIIAVIETDKAVVDFEAEHDGVLLRPLVAEGAEVAIGDPIAIIAATGEQVDDIDALVSSLLGVAATPDVSGNLAAGASLESAPQPAPQSTPVTAAGADARVFASPLARRLAREAGIDLIAVSGTGPHGRIRRLDIERHLAEAPGSLPSAAPATAPASATAAVAPPKVSADATSPEMIPHSRLRRAIASRLTQSKTQSPHFYLRGSAQVDRLLALRSEINDGEQVRVSVTDMLLKAMAEAFVRVPRSNVIWTDEAILRYSSVDIGLAVATDTGLVTPVVRGVESMGIRDIARTTTDLAARARAGSLRQHELEGGVTSLTNLGMYGTEDFDAIINPPQSSILAVGAAREVPVAHEGVVGIGNVIRFSLSVDHRPIDGAVAAEWMAAFTRFVELPGKLLLA